MQEELANPHYSDHLPEAHPPEGKEDIPWVDLSHLEPIEIFDVYRYARKISRTTWLREAMDEVLHYLPRMNRERAIEVFTAGVDSRDHEDRATVAGGEWLFELAKVDHEAAIGLLGQVHRDYDERVLDAAHGRLFAAALVRQS